jgi:hypothetical protein
VLPTTTTYREESKVEKLEIYHSVSLVVYREKKVFRKTLTLLKSGLAYAEYTLAKCFLL